MRAGLAWNGNKGVLWRWVRRTPVHTSVWVENPQDWRWWWSRWQLHQEETVVVAPPVRDCSFSCSRSTRWSGRPPMMLWDHSWQWKCPLKCLLTGLMQQKQLPNDGFSFCYEERFYRVAHHNGAVHSFSECQSDSDCLLHSTDEMLMWQAYGALYV